MIRTIHLSNSHVLVHCSDGWDRTSQLSALPQICLDPFYRTAKGLAVLIEKDWIAYGHKFTDRSGHLCNDRVEFHAKLGEDATTQQSFLASVQKQFAPSSHAFKETCPVFQQFLDCIYQIQSQFPDRFEWNETLLRKLVWETYSARTGSFLFNSEAERATYRARERTASVWEEIFDVDDVDSAAKEEGPKLVLKPEYRNDRYDPTLDDPDSKSPNADQGVLLFHPQDVRYWFELFGRSDDEMNRKPPVSAHERPQSPSVQTEHQIVTSAENDPVINPLSAHLSSSLAVDPATVLCATSPSGRSTSPANSGDAPQQLAETVQKFGWSAWKTVQKLGQEAAKQYKDRTSVENTVAGTDENGWSSSPRRSTDGASSGTGANAGMWSRFSTLSNNPWQQPSPNSPDSASTTTSVPYTPYEPRKTSSSTAEAPLPVRQASSALSINPWETISKEDAVPTPLAVSKSQLEPSRTSLDRSIETAERGASRTGDPLGVGGI